MKAAMGVILFFGRRNHYSAEGVVGGRFGRARAVVHAGLRRAAPYGSPPHEERTAGKHTLQTTALVHEVYLRMVDVTKVEWQQRAQFFAIAAQMMRRILVDAARARDSHKRGAGAVRVNFNETAIVSPEPDGSIVALDDALAAFAEVAPRQAKVVELRYFGGLQEEEIVEVLRISPRTVRRDWDFARAWLLRELS